MTLIICYVYCFVNYHARPMHAAIYVQSVAGMELFKRVPRKQWARCPPSVRQAFNCTE